MATMGSGDDQAALIEFLTARINDDEQVARQASTAIGADWARIVVTDPAGMPPEERVAAGDRLAALPGVQGGGGRAGVADHIADHDPARVLREVAAKRALLLRYGSVTWLRGKLARTPYPDMGGLADDMVLHAVRCMALAYDGHPDYDERWRP